MTKALQAAFEAAARLSEQKQDALASAILEEVALEAKWEEAFGRNQHQLERLADEALAEHRSGKTETLDLRKP